MFKNVAGQHWWLFEFDYTTGAPKTGDAANITVYVSKDTGTVTALGDTSVNEGSSSHAKGWYWGNLAQAETNADSLLLSGVSTTGNTSIAGKEIYTTPPNFNKLLIDSTGNVSDVSNANVAGINNVSTSSVTTVNANQGTTQPVNFTGTGNVALARVDVVDFAGTASAGTPGYVAPDWGNISAKTATVNLSATTISSVGNVSGTVGNVTGTPTVTVSSAGMTSISDNLLDRDMSAGTDSGNQTFRTPRQAFRALRNKNDCSNGTSEVVYKEDDTTQSWNQPITGNATAAPIVKVGT